MPTPTSTPAPRSIQVIRKEMVERNSFLLNFFGLVVILSIAYFLYSIYLERKIFSEYLQYIKNTQEEYYQTGFL